MTSADKEYIIEHFIDARCESVELFIDILEIYLSNPNDATLGSNISSILTPKITELLND